MKLITPPWRVLEDSRSSRADLAITLCGGQCFRWRPTASHSFVGVVGRRAYELRQTVAPNSAGATAKKQSARLKSRGDNGATFSSHVIEYRCLGIASPTATTSVSSSRARSVTRKRPRHAMTDHNGGIASSSVDDERLLASYLSLDVSLPILWQAWTVDNPMKTHPLVAYLTDSAVEGRARREGPVAAIRHLRQDIHEVLFSFLCSQNNNVKRITSMVAALCAEYGDPIVTETTCVSSTTIAERGGAGTADSAPDEGAGLHAFPTIAQLRAASEKRLRELGFGYRSKCIVGCVQSIASYRSRNLTETNQLTRAHSSDHPPSQHDASSLSCDFYRDLIQLTSLQEQRAMLLALPGVGRKVADCVLLFGLGHSELVPVDTHMAQVAAEYLSPAPAKPCGGKPSLKQFRASKTHSEQLDWQEVVRDWRWGVRPSRKASPAYAVMKVAAATTHNGKGKRKRSKSDEEPSLPSLTAKHHDAIQEGFIELFGSYAGWAHSILFYKRMR